MDLRSNYPFWLLDNGIIRSYPSLSEDLRAEVVVIGAGISGALAAWHLCKSGVRVVVVDRRHVGLGSTAASTALLQYEIDTPLIKLADLVGARNAARSYVLCRQSIYDLEKICRNWKDPGFKRRPSFQFASYRKDVRLLEREQAARSAIGIPVSLLDRAEIGTKFGLEKEAGLLSHDGAEVKAYSLAHALLYDCRRQEIGVYDHTEITGIHEQKRGVELITAEGWKIHARKLVIACGYESQRYIRKKVESLQTTYAIVSEPMEEKTMWYRNALIWETARPYLYLRTTPDNRILVGGKDVEGSDPSKREMNLNKKAKALETAFRKLFPRIEYKTDFKWGGLFGSTKDGLPYIGCLPGRPHTYFALGFGGNGITFSMIAAQMITRMIGGDHVPDAEIFSFTR